MSELLANRCSELLANYSNSELLANCCSGSKLHMCTLLASVAFACAMCYSRVSRLPRRPAAEGPWGRAGMHDTKQLLTGKTIQNIQLFLACYTTVLFFGWLSQTSTLLCYIWGVRLGAVPRALTDLVGAGQAGTWGHVCVCVSSFVVRCFCTSMVHDNRFF